MFAHVWKMQARKKKVEEYEEFGRRVTLPSLKKIEGCVDAHFLKVYEARKPQYLWVAFWKDNAALEAARTNPLWREQIRKFEEGKYYKTIPLELVCESLGSFQGAEAAAEAPVKAAPARTAKQGKAKKRKAAKAAETSKAAPAAEKMSSPEGGA
jgi:heme-degrading monooxygenase HmoA